MLLKPQQVNFGQAINCDEKIVGIRTTSSTINGARNKAIGLILQDSIFLLWAKCNRIYNPNGEMNRKEDRIGNSLRAPTPAPRVGVPTCLAGDAKNARSRLLFTWAVSQVTFAASSLEDAALPAVQKAGCLVGY